MFDYRLLFFFGLNALLLHFLHLTFLSIIFLGSALIFALQFLHTKTFLKSLACTAEIPAMLKNPPDFWHAQNFEEILSHFISTS
jgi:hypothetical protein